MFSSFRSLCFLLFFCGTSVKCSEVLRRVFVSRRWFDAEIRYWKTMRWRMRQNNRWHKLHLSKMRRPLLLHMLIPCPMEVSKMRNPTNIERVVRIRRKLKENRYFDGKCVYKREQWELTIPSRFKEVVEPFLNKDLKVEARQEGNNLIIEAKPVQRPP